MVSRLDPLPPEHTPELKDQFSSFLKSLGFVPNSVLTMQRSPKLLRAFVSLQGAIWGPDSEVDLGLKRLIAHMSSRSAGDAYSMAHTASGALHFGVKPEKLAAVANYATSPLFSPAEKAALQVAAAAGQVPNAVTDEMFVELRKHWSEAQIVETSRRSRLPALSTAGTPLWQRRSKTNRCRSVGTILLLRDGNRADTGTEIQELTRRLWQTSWQKILGGR